MPKINLQTSMNNILPQELGKKAHSLPKDGKKYKVEVKTIQHGLSWKVWQGVQAVFLTISSFGIGLVFPFWRKIIKDKLHLAYSGQEKIKIFTRHPPKDTSTSKVSTIGNMLSPSSSILPRKDKTQTVGIPVPEPKDTKILPRESKTQKVGIPVPVVPKKDAKPLSKEISDFIAAARKDITQIPMQDLENGLQEILKIGGDIINPEDKTTVFVISERVAQSYIQAGQFNEAWEVRINTAQAVTPGSPLADLDVQLDKEHPKLGLKLYPVDTGLFKNHTLAIQTRKYDDGTTQLHIGAKLNHPTRDRLQASINQIQINPQGFLNALPKGFCTNVKVSAENTFYEGRTLGKDNKRWDGNFSKKMINKHSAGFTPQADFKKDKPNDICESQVIEFEGVGKVKIGHSPNWRTEYNRISIELDPLVPKEEAGVKLHLIFAALGLGAVSSTSRAEDIERVKVMQLFRAFYPKEAFKFEREARSFEEPVERLKERIGNQVHGMKDKFQHYFEDFPEEIYPQEVYPGQSMWAIDGLAEDVRKEGGVGLFAGVYGNTFADAAYRFVSTLKNGALSTQDRFSVGITAAGQSSADDLKTGGASSVFLRMLTQGMPKNILDFPLSGEMQILYDLKLVERVGYAYPSDKYGTKDPTNYAKRDNIVQLTRTMEDNIKKELLNTHRSNEICIQGRVDPQFIKGVLVRNQLEKNTFIDTLRKEGLVTQNSLKEEFINGIPIDQFIRVGDAKATYWD